MPPVRSPGYKHVRFAACFSGVRTIILERMETYIIGTTESIVQIWPLASDTASTCFCTKCGKLNFGNYRETFQNIRSGHYPSEIERSVLSRSLDDARRCQVELDSRPDLSAQLEVRKLLVRTFIRGIQCILSPIRKLPEELLVEVLGFIISDYDFDSCEDIPNRIFARRIGVLGLQLPTFTLAHVCIRWYQLVNSTPALWSSFKYEHIGRHDKILHLFLDRSRLHHLDFWILGVATSGSFEDPSAITAQRNSSRWQRVAFHGTESFVREVLRPLANEISLPELVSLVVSTFSFSDVPLNLPIQCPRLKAITLCQLGLNLQFTCPSVKRLKLVRLSSEQALRLMDKCPNVKELTLSQIRFPLTKASKVITYHDLHTLKVDFGLSEHSPVAKVLDNLVLPSLTCLKLKALSLQDKPLPIDSLCSIFNRSRISLTHLSLECMIFTISDLLQLLPFLSSVTHLKYEELQGQWKEAERFLQMLIAPTPRSEREHNADDSPDLEAESDISDEENLVAILGEDRPCFLPRLKDLRLKISARTGTVIKVLRSRWRPELLSRSTHSDHLGEMKCVCLEKAQVEIFGRWGRRLWVGSEQFRGLEGMDVVVSFC